MVAELINIFETFLPQLLCYPNPNDPLNGEAAALLMRHPKEYEAKVKGPYLRSLVRGYGSQTMSYDADYVQRFATKEAADLAGDTNEDDEDAEMSDMGSITDDDDDRAA
ncbi:hypothetical protein EYR36_005946 [Pleurotus pulmonarius]|nr:hypothetical protein EYR36_005946 [Pleurotus pulmonarius]KAF4600653.1 hypothetical protein EYR38_005296 [Pleurotus pulmonarius]